jgi:hypothetical protein
MSGVTFDFQEGSLADSGDTAEGEAGVSWPPENSTDVLLEIQNSQAYAGLDIITYWAHEDGGMKIND